MNVGQLMQKGLDLWNAAMAGNYFLALSLAFEIVQALKDNLPPMAFADMLTTPPYVQGDKSLDELLAEFKAVCDNPPVAATAAVDGAVINVLLPLLQPLIAALLKKLIGL